MEHTANALGKEAWPCAATMDDTYPTTGAAATLHLVSLFQCRIYFVFLFVVNTQVVF